MYAGTKKIFGKEYKNFCECMEILADEDNLPATVRMEETFGLTCQDIADLCSDFKKDTGLELIGYFFLCDECDKLHITLQIDYPEDENDDDNTYLQ